MSSGSYTSTVYRIEARTSYPHPQEYAGMLLGDAWQEIPVNNVNPFERGGVNNHHYSSAGKHGFLTYEAAEALRWAFHANDTLAACVETRIVAYDYEEKWSATKKAVGPVQEWPRRPWDVFEPVEPEGIEP